MTYSFRIRRLQKKRGVEKLIELLRRSKNPETKRQVTMALVSIGEPAVDKLVEALGDDDCEVQRNVITALGDIGDRRAVAPLIATLGDYHLRAFTVQALANIGDAKAVEPLIRLSKTDRFFTPNHIVSATNGVIVEALKELEVPSRPDIEVLRLIAINDWSSLVAMGDYAVGPLIETLKDTYKNYQIAFQCTEIVRTLSEIGEPAFEPLIEALKSRNMLLRRDAAEVLGNISDPRALRSLAAALMDPQGLVRKASAIAIQQIESPEDPRIETLCAIALEDWGKVASLGTEAVKPAIEALGLRNIGTISIIEVLGTIGDERAVQPLAEILDTWNEDIRNAAAASLSMIGGPITTSATPTRYT